MAMYKETQTVVIYSCIIDFLRVESKVSPLVKSKRNYEYETTPDDNWDIRKITWEGSKERFSFNDDTNGNKGCTFWSEKISACNTTNVAATCRPMVLQQNKSVSITILTSSLCTVSPTDLPLLQVMVHTGLVYSPEP